MFGWDIILLEYNFGLRYNIVFFHILIGKKVLILIFYYSY